MGKSKLQRASGNLQNESGDRQRRFFVRQIESGNWQLRSFNHKIQFGDWQIRQVGLQGHFRLTRGARLFERAAFVFHRTHKERWIEKVATEQKDFSQKHERDARRIADVARLVIHDLVAGIDERAAGEIEPLADADGDDDFVFRRVADVEILLDVFVDGAAQFDEAEVGRVMRLALFERVDAGLADVPGRVEIRFPRRRVRWRPSSWRRCQKSRGCPTWAG